MIRFFNTGRMYNADDQPIIWQRLPSGVIMFRDLARGIDGYIDDCAPNAHAIMHRYDRGQYASWPREGEPHWYTVEGVEEAAQRAREAPRLRI